MTHSEVLDYRNKIVLAPMVRVGTLPMRLLALRHGADIVYTEELIDWKFLRSRRRVNDALGTVDFIDMSDGTVVFRTCAEEKSKVVLQIGTADAARALKVAKMVENDVAAIDINMGCPKEFSIKGGMGAALLSQPDKAKLILKTLVDGVKIPVTCKIRILSTIDATIDLVKQLESTGISAIAIHGRTRDERPQHPPHPDVVRQVAKSISIPVIANGGSKDIEKFTDILKFRDACGASSIMVARAAQWNVTIFRPDGMLPMDDVIREYLKLAIDYDNQSANSKYFVQNMLRELQETPRGRRFLDCQTLEQICEIWDMGQYCRQKQLELQQLGNFGRREVNPKMLSDEPKVKRAKLDDDITEHNVAFFKSNYPSSNVLPKTKLHVYAARHDKEIPTYEVQQEEKLFRAIITFDGKRYVSSYWEKNKKLAEQGAALVCLFALGIESEEDLIKNGSILR